MKRGVSPSHMTDLAVIFCSCSKPVRCAWKNSGPEMNWECAHAHMHFTRSACLSGSRSAACAPCVTNPSCGSTQTLRRAQRDPWTPRRCEGAGKRGEALAEKNTHIKYTRNDGQRSSLRHLTGNVDNDPKWPPCC